MFTVLSSNAGRSLVQNKCSYFLQKLHSTSTSIINQQIQQWIAKYERWWSWIGVDITWIIAVTWRSIIGKARSWFTRHDWCIHFALTGKVNTASSAKRASRSDHNKSPACKTAQEITMVNNIRSESMFSILQAKNETTIRSSLRFWHIYPIQWKPLK